MATEIEGAQTAGGLKVALAVSRFNSFVTDRLLEGALDSLRRAGAAEEDLTVVKVPGAWELPMAVRRLCAATKRPDAVVALGAVIRGGTPHFEFVSAEAVKGCAAASAESGIPVALGILTTDTLEQAVERAGLKGGNKGIEAAMAAVEMANLLRALR